jgi:hypothetical protein
VTAWPERRRGGVVAAVAARAEAWLLEPAPPAARIVAERPPPPRPAVAVIGLASRCGTTTIARALAAELARRDPGGVAVVSAAAVPPPSSASLATGAARRLARTIRGRPVGRLVLLPDDDPGLRGVVLDRAAPLVLDVGHGTPPESALALADRAVLVASPDVEPALAEVAAGALACDGAAPLLVLNRALEDAAWGDRPAVTICESRLGARLAQAGRDPAGALRAAAALLADACAEVVTDA